MTHAFTLLFGRVFSGSRYPPPASEPPARRPMKIEVQPMPDYLWRELGFLQAKRPEDDI